MLYKNFTFFPALFITAAASFHIYSIVAFGAKADGTVLNTTSILSAIDECYNKGGDTQSEKGVWRNDRKIV